MADVNPTNEEWGTMWRDFRDTSGLGKEQAFRAEWRAKGVCPPTRKTLAKFTRIALSR